MYTGTLCVVVCLYIYYKVCTVNPGTVTKTNVSEVIKRFSFDEHVFTANNTCTTCKTIK